MQAVERKYQKRKRKEEGLKGKSYYSRPSEHLNVWIEREESRVAEKLRRGTIKEERIGPNGSRNMKR